MNENQQEKLNKRIEQGNLVYSINLKEKTASVIDQKNLKKDIIIPRSVNYESNEYTITSISKRAFQFSQIDTVQFSPDSSIQTIEPEAFFFSTIQCISIPPSLIELKTGWCSDTKSLSKVIVSPNNEIYKIYEDKFIIGKSSKKEKNFDVLVFVFRDTQEVTIPNFIKHIETCAFEGCKSIEIPEDSILETVSYKAFCGSSIESIKFPSCLIELENGWCGGTPQLTKVQIDEKNARYLVYNDFVLEKSSKEAKNFDVISFGARNIQKVTIPSFIKHIKSYAFNICKQIETIEFMPDSQLVEIDNSAFLASSIQNFVIPSSVTRINEYAFHYCQQLLSIEIPIDSKLQTIEQCAFSYSSIEKFIVPRHLTRICENTFQECNKLRRIEIPDDSELQTIEKFAFQGSAIENISIPSNLIELNDSWCFDTRHITKIDVSPNNPLFSIYEDKFILGKSSKEEKYFDILVFCVRNVKKVTIPSFIKHIGSCAFERCKRLHTVNVLFDSQLQTIGTNAFSQSSLKSFTIPSSLTLISDNSFHYCSKLKKIKITENSKLHTIGKYAFSNTRINCFSIPQHVKNIDENIFVFNKEIQIIEFNNNSEIEFINQNMFKSCGKNILFMIPKNLSDKFNFYKIIKHVK